MKPSRPGADIDGLAALAAEQIDQMSYEDAMKTLEQVVEALESEGTQLAMGLKLYEVGTLLSRKCAADLDRTEARMIQLLGEAEAAREAPFDPEKEGR